MGPGGGNRRSEPFFEEQVRVGVVVEAVDFGPAEAGIEGGGFGQGGVGIEPKERDRQGAGFGLQALPKASASWVLSDEDFYPEWGEFKVRGAFGAFNGKDDRGFLVFAGARPDYWDEWKDRVKAMFDSIEVLEIDYTEMLTDWEYRIAGMSLVPKNPPTKGPWTPQAINLCADGTVVDDGADPAPAVTYATVWNGYAWVSVPRVKPPTRWKVVPDKGRPLLLVGDAIPIEFTLEMKGGQLWMNKKPYDIVDNKACPKS